MNKFIAVGIVVLIAFVVMSSTSDSKASTHLLSNTSCPMAHCNQRLDDGMLVDAILGPVSQQWHFAENRGSGIGLGASIGTDFAVITFRGTTAYDDTYVHALNFDGTVRWDSGFRLNGLVATSAPLIDENDNVYIADNNVAIKFAPDGSVVWEVLHPGLISPVSFNMTDEGLLFGAGAVGPAWLVDRNSGTIVDQLTPIAFIDGKLGSFVTANTPSVRGTRVYVVSNFRPFDGSDSSLGRLYAFETSGGVLSVAWFFEFRGPSGGSPTIVNDRIYFDGRGQTPDGAGTGLIMFGLRDVGNTYDLLWSTDVQNDSDGGVSIQVSPAVDPNGGVWLFASRGKKLMLLDELTGSLLRSLDINELVNVQGVDYFPSSVMTIASNLGSPVMYVGVSPRASIAGSRFVMAIDLNASQSIWKYDLGPSWANATHAQIAITQPSEVQSEPLLIVPTYGNGVRALGTVVAPNNTPTANVGGPYSGTVGIALSFNGSASSDLDGDPLTYSWDFGDGNTGTGVSPNHTYAAAGSYTVNLTVNDGTVSSAPATTNASIGGGSTLDVTIENFSAKNVKKGNYGIKADIRNKSATESVTVTASLVILNSSDTIVDVLPDVTMTIGARGKVKFEWKQPTTLAKGTYTAKVVIADEDPPEEANTTFKVN